MIPEDVLAESREKAQAIVCQDRPTSWVTAAVIIAIWVLVAILAIAILGKTIRE
ncbi:MAG: hypothetical protein PVG71_15395 [Anaerolineae bacterium]|jgi:hypothetical protein